MNQSLVSASLVLVVWAANVAAQDSPAEKTVLAQFQQLQASHAFFKKVTCTPVFRPPFVFFVQRPEKDDPLYANMVINQQLPYLKQLVTLFEQDYVKPAGLTPCSVAGVYPIVILNSAGAYRNYSQAVESPGLRMARAHYDPELRIAVTYEDTFAQGNSDPETRHAIRHEFVHALQHAYTKTKGMTDALWLAEGLADYRASAGNMPDSLAKPPLMDGHLALLRQVYTDPKIRGIASTVEEIVSMHSYGEVVQLVNRRMAGFKADDIVRVYYAQSEMLVRFLHEGAGGKYKAQFLRYLSDVLGGADSKAAFVGEFGQDGKFDFATFEAEYTRWAIGVLNGEDPATAGSKTPNGAKAGPPAPVAPTVFDPAGLQWTPAEAGAKVDLARRLGATGDFGAALKALPATADALAQREKARLEAGNTLRQVVIDDAVQRKATLPVLIDGAEVRTRVLRRDGDVVFVQGKKGEQSLGTGGIALATLLREGARLKRFEGIERWLDGWLRWLDGAPLASLKRQLDGEHSKMVALRGDLTTDFGDRGKDAFALAWLQQLQLPTEPKAANAVLAEFQAKVLPWLSGPVLASRRDLLKTFVRALAERAYDPTDPSGIGIAAPCERLPDGRLRVVYDGKSDRAAADFAPATAGRMKELLDSLPKLAFDGPPQLRTVGGALQLIGSGLTGWPVSLKGHQVVELKWIPSENAFFQVMINDEGEKGTLMVSPFGTVRVHDAAKGILDDVGDGVQLQAGKASTLRIEHDGDKHLVVSVDGKRTANVQSTGERKQGRMAILVHTSTAITVEQLTIEGQVELGDPGAARARHGERVVAKLFP